MKITPHKRYDFLMELSVLSTVSFFIDWTKQTAVNTRGGLSKSIKYEYFSRVYYYLDNYKSMSIASYLEYITGSILNEDQVPSVVKKYVITIKKEMRWGGDFFLYQTFFMLASQFYSLVAIFQRFIIEKQGIDIVVKDDIIKKSSHCVRAIEKKATMKKRVKANLKEKRICKIHSNKKS